MINITVLGYLFFILVGAACSHFIVLGIIGPVKPKDGPKEEIEP